jgi:linoleoyl-CoA desaturase
MINYNFSHNQDLAFYNELRTEVNYHFVKNGITRKANNLMRLKSVIFFSLYVSLYLLILIGGITNVTGLFICWALLGIGQALLGMNIMHDTVHEAYTANSLAKYVLQIPIILIGVESKIWRIEHNILHHTYTNIEGLDQDIHPRFFFRFSANQKKRWFHKYQHLYATLLYGFLIIEWLTVKDFIKIYKYFKQGIIKTKMEAIRVILSILCKKSIFYLVFLLLPLWILPYPAATIALMFLTMIVIAGIIMTVIFQLAHVVPNTAFISQNDSEIAKNWHIHQMLTTANFATNNRVVTYLLGGLNYQIENHLCHVHYPSIAIIVRSTAQKFNIPYIENSTFSGAIKSHYHLLQRLGSE